jgi:hypothetical protein
MVFLLLVILSLGGKMRCQAKVAFAGLKIEHSNRFRGRKGPLNLLFTLESLFLERISRPAFRKA